MSRSIILKKGYDIPVTGSPEKIIVADNTSNRFGLKPIDFPGLTPKLIVKHGDSVLAGSPLFQDKLNPGILFTSPVSGTVLSVERGERRKILEVVVEKNDNPGIDYGKADPMELTGEQIRNRLMVAGVWPSIRQRPYNVIARPDVKPKSVFIPGFDTAPLAPDMNFIMDNMPADLFQAGVNAISRMTDGKINLVLNGRSEPSKTFLNVRGVEISYFSGPHPAGNPGVHIHHLDPVNKGEVVWIINPQDMVTIGRLFAEGIYNPVRIIALTGSEVINPRYYRTISGASVAPLLSGNINTGKNRYISGNLLTGTKITENGFLGYYDSQVTVIPEGDYYELLGWASPGADKLSFSHTFLSKLFPARKYRADTNLHGGERAFVMTGQYEKVVPMDIYPMQLFKAILAGDIELMENLGIYEVAEEDFALCEFICPSKIEIQSIIRQGLDIMKKEMS